MTAMPDLPPSDSAKLALLHPTPEEKKATWNLNGQVWRGNMDLPTYIRRETYIGNQALTRDGGITFWILVDTSLPPNERPILASCESLRKQAVIVQENGQVTDTTSHGICSVFCNPEYRGRRYARRMINELGNKLDNWQQKEGERASFTVLYSDIGKTFYSRMGWHAFPSSHIALRPTRSSEKSVAQHLFADDLAKLCELDEEWLRKEIGRPRNSEPKACVALIPDVKTMRWHHAREEFAAKEMLGRDADIKGAYTKTDAGDQVWCIWTRTFGSEEVGNILNILRLVIEGEKLCRSDGAEPASLDALNQMKVQSATAVLRASQLQAAEWNMENVQIWNPTPLIVRAVREIEPTSEVIHRDEESIASLRWHGVYPKELSRIQWVGNNKYGWC